MNANEVVTLFFPSRLGRGSYFIRGCATTLLVWGFIGGSGGSGPTIESNVMATILVLLAFVYSTFWVVLPIWGFIGGSGGSGPTIESNVMVTILVLLAFVYSTFWVVLPRMRDISMRPFWLILMLVPGIDVGFGLVLMFRPSAIAWPRSSDTPESQGTARN